MYVVDRLISSSIENKTRHAPPLPVGQLNQFNMAENLDHLIR